MGDGKSQESAPCKHCADRKIGCHGVCTKYAEFVETRKALANWKRDHRYVRVYEGDFSTSGPAPGKRKRATHKSAWLR